MDDKKIREKFINEVVKILKAYEVPFKTKNLKAIPNRETGSFTYMIPLKYWEHKKNKDE